MNNKKRIRTQADKDIRRHHWFRVGITAVEILLIAIAIYFIVTICNSIGMAEDLDEREEEYQIMYAICTKGDRVNVRPFPNTGNDPIGWLEPGDIVYLDGPKKNGFYHCVGINTEAGGGWIYKGYLVEDPPELINRTGVIAANDKVHARKCVNGKHTRWLKPGGTVKVSYWSDEWCVTDCGYVMSKFIELDGE